MTRSLAIPALLLTLASTSVSAQVSNGSVSISPTTEVPYLMCHSPQMGFLF